MIDYSKPLLIISAAIVMLTVGGCTSISSPSKAIANKAPSEIPDAVPKIEPLSRYGNPEWYVVFGEKYEVMTDAKGFTQEGTASWYGKKFHGRRTSSGETYDMYAMTAAHKSLPLPSYVRVTNLNDQSTAIVKVNDRGPFVGDRIIDLSFSAAKKLGVVADGTAPVSIEVIDPNEYRAPLVANVDEAVITNGSSSDTIVLDKADADVPPPPVTLPGDVPTNASITKIESSENSIIYLQAGAFSVDTNAQQFAEQLRVSQQSPVSVESGKDDLFRVLVGPFLTLGVADSVAESLQTDQQIKAQVVTKDYIIQ